MNTTTSRLALFRNNSGSTSRPFSSSSFRSRNATSNCALSTSRNAADALPAPTTSCPNPCNIMVSVLRMLSSSSIIRICMKLFPAWDSPVAKLYRKFAGNASRFPAAGEHSNSSLQISSPRAGPACRLIDFRSWLVQIPHNRGYRRGLSLGRPEKIFRLWPGDPARLTRTRCRPQLIAPAPASLRISRGRTRRKWTVDGRGGIVSRSSATSGGTSTAKVRCVRDRMSADPLRTMGSRVREVICEMKKSGFLPAW